MLADKINLQKQLRPNLNKPSDTRTPVTLAQKRKAKEATKRWNLPEIETEEPADNLVSIGGGFFASPNEPVDPTDCEHYPDSPWCGENPFTLTPVAVEPKLVVDKCNIGVQFDGVFGFVKLPPIQIVFRNPDCQPEVPPPPPPEPIPGDAYKMPPGCPIGVQVSVLAQRKSYEKYDSGYERSFSRSTEISKVIYPLKEKVATGDVYADVAIYCAVSEEATFNTRSVYGADVLQVAANHLAIGGTIEGDISDPKTVWRRQGTIDCILYFSLDPGKPQNIKIISSSGILGSIIPNVDVSLTDAATYSAYNLKNTFTRRVPLPQTWWDAYTYQLLYICGDVDFVPPPPPPKPKECKCKCMCCDDNKPNDDALLKLILKRIGSLPASVPDDFTKKKPSTIKIESLAELALWQAKQMDSLAGAYPIEIEIEDSDLVKEGNQKQKIVIPNQAEAMAELIGIALTTKRDTHATLVTSIKAMAEAGMTKNIAVQILDVVLGNAEFLGYKLEQFKKKVPSLFTPNGKNISETLREKEVEIISYKNADKNDLKDDLNKLLTMASRWNAQNWRQVAGDGVEVLKQYLLGNPKAIKEEHKDAEQGDFNDFTEQAERGFIEVSGITDTINPWGREYKQRPKIREIGTDKGNYDEEGKPKPKLEKKD